MKGFFASTGVVFEGKRLFEAGEGTMFFGGWSALSSSGSKTASWFSGVFEQTSDRFATNSRSGESSVIPGRVEFRFMVPFRLPALPFLDVDAALGFNLPETEVLDNSCCGMFGSLFCEGRRDRPAVFSLPSAMARNPDGGSVGGFTMLSGGDPSVALKEKGYYQQRIFPKFLQ